MQAWLHQLKLLVINDVSMIPDKMLHFLTRDFVLENKFISQQPLLSGDFFQLCPVGGLPLFAEHNPHEVNDLAPSLWSVFDFMELTQIMRQSNDTGFASLLNKIHTRT